MIYMHSKWLLIALPLIIFIIISIIRRSIRFSRALVHLSAQEHRSYMFKHYSEARFIAKIVCMALALLLLACALLRVQYDSKQEQSRIGFTRDLIIALDISRSMLAQDAHPTRLTLVKQKIKQLLSQLTCERVGLIVFSGQALVYCPLTADFNTFNLFLDGVDVESISQGTTHISAALQTALELWQRSKESQSKILILCTDGEDFSHNLQELKQAAKSAYVQPCIWGVGSTQGSPIPLFDNQEKIIGHMKDAQGSIVMTKLNEQMLSSIAQDLGGLYIHINETNNTDIERTYQWIMKFEQEQVYIDPVQNRGETFMIATGIALVLLIIGWIL